jgi:hypothetical protein
MAFIDGVIIGTILIAIVIHYSIWIWVLVNTLKKKQYYWFVLTFIVQILWIPYLIWGKK